MREALDLARKGRALASPNPMVGAVLVRDGEVVGRGFHTYAGVKHAEIIALDAGRRAGPRRHPLSQPGALLAPGPHAALRRRADRRRRGARGGAHRRIPTRWWRAKASARLRAAGIEVEIAAEFAAEAEKLNEPFLHFMRTGRPLVTLKTAITLDGKISAPDDNRGWITSERARAHVQELRHDHDAILTGIGTVLADDCLLTDRTGLPRSRPLLRIVHGFAACACRSIPKWCAAPRAMCWWSPPRPPPPSAARRSKRAASQVLVFDGPGGRADLRGVVDWLGRQRYLSLMIEAGSKLNWTALETGVVDRIFFYYGAQDSGRPGSRCRWPAASGGGAAPTPSASTASPSIPFRPTSSPSKDTWMFTGIIEELGTVESSRRARPARV